MTAARIDVLLFLTALTAGAHGAEFTLPYDATLYLQPAGGDAGAVTDFGLGTSPADFVVAFTGLPRNPSPNAEVSVGRFLAGQTVHFAMRTTFSAQYWAFSSDTTTPASRGAFLDPDNSLHLGGDIYEQTAPDTWLIHLDDAASYMYDDDDNDILIRIRLVPDDCNTNAIADNQDITAGTSADCNTNNRPDECDIAVGDSRDDDLNSVPDECAPPCSPPQVVLQPLSQTICAGGALTLAVSAQAVPRPTIQWRRDGVGIAGATTEVYEILAAPTEASAAYDAQIENPCGSIISDAAIAVVWPLGTGDINGDGIVDGGDIGPFIEVLMAGPTTLPGLAACAADMNPDGRLDEADVSLFLAALLPT